MQQSSAEILGSILKLLNIQSDRTKVQKFYNNYPNIIRTIHKIISQSQEATYLGINLYHLNQIKATQVTQYFYGALILRLLYIDRPESLICQAMASMSKQTKAFLMLKSIAQQLLSPKSQLLKMQIAECQELLIKYLQIVREQVESQISLIKAIPIEYKYQNFTHIYQTQIALNSQNTPPSTKKSLFSRRVNQTPQSKGYSELCAMYDEVLQEFVQQSDMQLVYNIINHISLTLGAVFYFQTICQRHQLLTDQKILSSQDKNMITQFKTHAFLTAFDLRVEIYGKNQNKNRCFLNIFIRFRDTDISSISANQFFFKQRKIGKYITTKSIGRQSFGHDLSLYISEMIYSIDFSKIIASGTFGSAYCAKALRLHSIREQMQNKEFLKLFFLQKQIIVKRLKYDTEAYQKLGYKVDQKRELLILQLLKEIKHHQNLKGARRRLGLEVERELVGINSLITPQESMKIPDLSIDESNSSAASHKYNRLLSFQRGTTSMEQRDMLVGVRDRAKKEAIIYKIYKQVFQGLYCLHTDINKLYNHLLNKYFQYQDKKEENQAIAKINRTDRCGIYHRDIKGANIIISFLEPIYLHIEAIKVQIIDFGMAGIANFEKYRTITSCGSSHFMAPEIKAGDNYDEKVDIWSIGVVLYQHLNRTKLFRRYDKSNAIKINQELIDKQTADLEKEVQQKKWAQIVKGCLKVDPKGRNTSGEILQMLQNHKLVLTHEQSQVIQRFYCDQDKIVSTKARLMEDQYEQVQIAVIAPEISFASRKSSVHYSTIQDFITNSLLTPQQKLPVILSFLSLFINARVLPQVSTNILLAIRQHQVLLFEKEGDNTRHEKSVFIDFRLVKEKAELHLPEGVQKFEIKGKDTIVIRIENYQISQQIQLIVETSSQTKYQKKCYKLILSKDKKYLLTSKPDSFIYGGYQLQTDLVNNYHLTRTLFEYHNQRYTELSAPFQLLASSKIDTLQARKHLEIYWYHSGFQTSDQSIIIKLKELFQLIKIQIDRGKMIRLKEFKSKSGLSLQSKNRLLLLCLIEVQDNTLCISLLQSSLLTLIHLIKTHQPQQLFSSVIKQSISYMFQCFKNQSLNLPYQYMFELSLLHFSSQLPQYLNWCYVLKRYKSNKQLIITELNLLLASIVEANPITSKLKGKIEDADSYWHLGAPKKRKLELNLIEALVQELSAVAFEIEQLLEGRFGLKKFKIQKQLLYKQKEKPPSLNTMFSMIQKILRNNKQRLINLPELQQKLANHKQVLVTLDILRGIFKGCSSSKGHSKDLCPKVWFDELSRKQK